MVDHTRSFIKEALLYAFFPRIPEIPPPTRKKQGYPQSVNGFTLIEALIAVAVLMVGVLILEKNIVSSTMSNNSTRLTTSAVAEASGVLERLQNLPYDCRRGGAGCGAGYVCNAPNGCLNLEDVAPNNRLDDTADAVNDDLVVTADRAITWDAAGREIVTENGGALPANFRQVTVFVNICDNCPPPAGGAVINNAKLIRVISRYRDPGRPNDVANNDALSLSPRTRQNQQTVVDYVKSQVQDQ